MRNSWQQHEPPVSPSCKVLTKSSEKSSNPAVKSTSPPVVNQPSPHKPIGLHNKGNTCYANSILQALCTVPALWCQASSEGSDTSALCKSLTLTMSSIEQAKVSFDPSKFLRSLQTHVHTQDSHFNFNTQQDAAYILGILLDELKGCSIVADEIFSISCQSSVVCSECSFISTTDKRLDMLPLQPCKNARASLSKYLEVELLDGANKYNCPLCETLREGTIQKNISRCGNILICHLKRFNNFLDNTFKDCSYFFVKVLSLFLYQ